jgi:hypothetical protein
MDKIVIEVQLPCEQAWALAQFLKRAGYSNYRTLAASEQEAYEMLYAAQSVSAALAEEGCAPR